MSGLQSGLHFLVSSVLDIFIYLLLLRLLFQWARVDYQNPLVQSIVKFTQWPLARVRRFVPGFKGMDWSVLVLILIVGFIKWTLLGFLVGNFYAPLGILATVIMELLHTTSWLFLIAIIVVALSSWFQSAAHHPVVQVVRQLVSPLLDPVRRLLPDMGGLDLSPIAVLLLIQFLQISFIAPGVRAAMSML